MYSIEPLNDIKVYGDHIRKAVNVEELKDNFNKHPYTYQVDHCVELEHDLWYKFTNNLLFDYEFFQECLDMGLNHVMVGLVGGGMAYSGSGEPDAIVVDLQGYSYARYCGLISKVDNA